MILNTNPYRPPESRNETKAAPRSILNDIDNWGGVFFLGINSILAVVVLAAIVWLLAFSFWPT